MSDYEIKKTEHAEILVVTDAPHTREQLGAVLSNNGFRVRHASDGACALHSAKDRLPDLIMMDFHLPDMKGTEACRLLKSDESFRNVPVVITNAAGRKEEMKESFRAGGADYITAPFDPEEVPARVEAILAAARRLKLQEKGRLTHIRFLENLDRIGAAIHKAHDLNGMLQDVIRTVFSIFDCDRSWLMYPCDPAADTYRIPVEICKPEYPGANLFDLDIPMKPGADKVCSAALASDAPVTYGPEGDLPIYAELTEQFGVRAQMTLAVFPKTGKPWIFGMHQCSSARVFTEQEKSLFKEIGRRVADGLSSMLLLRDLKESEEKLGSTLESLDDLVFVLDSRGIFRDLHLPAGKEDLLTSPEGFTGKSFREVIPAPSVPPFEAAFKAVMETGVVQQFDYHLNLSGNIRWFSAKFSIRRDAAGECAGVTVVCREITNRKLAEEALRDNEERYRAAIENSNDGIAMAESGNFLFVNEKMLEIFEYDSPEELVGKSITTTIIHPDDQKRLSSYARLREKGHPVPERYEAMGVTKKGRRVHFDLSVTRITYRDRKVSLIFLKDITQQKDLEKQLTQAQKMEAIGTLAGGIAHDFNNILGAILGRAELALLPSMKESDIRRHLKEILISGKRATELVRQILAFSRRKNLDLKPLKLSLLVDETLKMLRASLPSTIRISRNFEDRDGMIMSNATQIHQVLMNLGTNAAHAVRGKNGILTVTLRNETMDSSIASVSNALKPGDYVKLSVSDNGHGIDRPMLDRIFDPYFSTKKQGEGTGLGLSVVHSIIKNSGGGISVKSTPGRGTTFHIYLPRIELSRTAPPKALPEGGFISGRGKILLVDDEETLVSIGKDILEFLGYDVTTMTSSRAALILFEEEPERFDMVVTDLTMPEITGDELARRLMAIRPDIPIILCTGYGDLLTRTQAESMGIRKFLLKPLSMDQLSSAIKDVLESSALPRGR